MSDSTPLDPIAEARRHWSARWGDAATPAMTAVTSIMRAQQILMGRLNLELQPYDLTFPRYEALMILHLSRRGAMPLGKLGQRLQVHPTSVTSLVDGLERRGYSVRIPHEHDRRTTLAQITDAGRVVAEEATAALNTARFCTQPLRRSALTTIADVLYSLRADADDLPRKRARPQRATT